MWGGWDVLFTGLDFCHILLACVFLYSNNRCFVYTRSGYFIQSTYRAVVRMQIVLLSESVELLGAIFSSILPSDTCHA